MTKFKPILFSTPMVKAILAGDKTQTRRGVKPQPKYPEMEFKHFIGEYAYFETPKGHEDPTMYHAKRKYNVGDILWVREKFCVGAVAVGELPDGRDSEPYVAQAKNDTDLIPYEWCVSNNIEIEDVKWKPSIFMPKAACRIFLEIIDIRVERLRDISEQDAIAEGIERCDDSEFAPIMKVHPTLWWKSYTPDRKYWENAINSFRSLWVSINGVESYEKNPYVWVVEFKQIPKPTNFEL